MILSWQILRLTFITQVRGKKQLKSFSSWKFYFSDTNSLIYEIEHPDIYDFIKQNIDEFDTGNFKEDKPYGIPRNNATVVIKMKS